MSQTERHIHEDPQAYADERASFQKALSLVYPEWTSNRIKREVEVLVRRQGHRAKLLRAVDLASSTAWRHLRHRHPLLFKKDLTTEEREEIRRQYPHLHVTR